MHNLIIIIQNSDKFNTHDWWEIQVKMKDITELNRSQMEICFLSLSHS